MRPLAVAALLALLLPAPVLADDDGSDGEKVEQSSDQASGNKGDEDDPEDELQIEDEHRDDDETDKSAGKDAEPEDIILRIVGRNVDVAILEEDNVIDAKVDTGADSTTIDARDIEEFERDGAKWVRFRMPLEDGKGIQFEREVVDTVTIIKAEADNIDRYVVEMDLCVGDVMLRTEVNLSNRKGLSTRMLLGREFLIRGHFLVNPAQSGRVKPICDGLLEN